MRNFLFLLICLCAALWAQQDDVIELYVGQQKSLSVKDALQVSIAGGGRVARATLVNSGNEVIVTGVTPGVVSCTISFRDGRKEAMTLTVIGREAEELFAEVKRICADLQTLSVKRVGNGVELGGTVTSEEEARRAAMVAERFPEVMNFTRDTRSDVLIQIDAEIIEISLADASDLGIDWFGQTTAAASFSGGVNYGNVVNEGASVVVGEKSIPTVLFPKPSYAVGTFARLNPLTAKLHFLITKGKGSVLARPKLVCRSGMKADFLVGGEVPIPYATNEQIEVNWKQFGIKLDVSPVLLRTDGKEIEVRIACEISDLDWANAVDKYPALSRKEVHTQVKMNADEMLALAGLISKKKSRVQKRLPFFGAIPFLGRIFSSTRDEVKDVETVILLTPRIVKAGTGDNISIESPR